VLLRDIAARQGFGDATSLNNTQSTAIERPAIIIGESDSGGVTLRIASRRGSARMCIARLSVACVVVVARAAVFGASLLFSSEAAAEAPPGSSLALSDRPTGGRS
jgi:hypothetical protein